MLAECQFEKVYIAFRARCNPIEHLVMDAVLESVSGEFFSHGSVCISRSIDGISSS